MDRETLKSALCEYIDKANIDDLLMFIPAKLSEDGLEIKHYLVDSEGRKWDAKISDENFLKNYLQK